MSEEKKVETKDVKKSPVDVNEKKHADPEVVKTKNPESISYRRFREVNQRAIKAEAKIAKMEEVQKTEAEDRKKKTGEFKDLFEAEKSAHGKTKEVADKWTAYEKSRREVLMGKIPEEDRDIYEGLALEKLEKVVEKISKGTSLGVNAESPTRHTAKTEKEKKGFFRKSDSEKREGWQDHLKSYLI